MPLGDNYQLLTTTINLDIILLVSSVSLYYNFLCIHNSF